LSCVWPARSGPFQKADRYRNASLVIIGLKRYESANIPNRIRHHGGCMIRPLLFAMPMRAAARGRVFFPTLIVLAALFFQPWAVSAEPLLFLAEAGYAPYSFANGEQPRGIDCEIVQELARRLDLDVNFKFLPRARMLDELRQGRAQGVVALGYIPELSPLLAYARKQPLRVNQYDLFSHGADRLNYQSPLSLTGKTIALPQGVPLPEELQRSASEEQFKVLRAPAEADCIRLLLMRQVDAFVGQAEATFNLLGKMGMTSTIIAAGTTIARDTSYLAVARNAGVNKPEALARLMELVLAEMLADGAYREIQRRYLVQ